MEKPSAVAIKLYQIGWIHGLFVEQQQTGTDTADTFCVITGSKNVVKGKWATYAKYLDVCVGHSYVAKLKQKYAVQVERWKEFERVNKKELAEYERLKAKFES